MAGRPRGFRFRSAWRHLPAPPARVYAVLERIEDYPKWWPQVREVASRDASSGTVRLRSALPLEHRVTLRGDRRNPATGELSVTMAGDLRGWVECTVTGDGRGGSHVAFRQYTEVTRPLLRLLAATAGPLLRVNHALMMRAGCRGLRARLRRLDDG